MSEPQTDYDVDDAIAAIQGSYAALIPGELDDLMAAQTWAYNDITTANAAATALASWTPTGDTAADLTTLAGRIRDLNVWRASLDLHFVKSARACEVISRYLTGLEITG